MNFNAFSFISIQEDSTGHLVYNVYRSYVLFVFTNGITINHKKIDKDINFRSEPSNHPVHFSGSVRDSN